MSQEQLKQARNTRRRRTQERQAVVFGLLILLLAGVGLAGVGIYTGAIAFPFDRDFSFEEKPVDVQVATPCLPADTLPVPASKIKLAVLNASDRSGLAAVVAGSLEDRNFVIAQTGNASEHRASVAVKFGIDGVANGYTVAAHFPNAALILDDREDSSVDVALGQFFTDLVAIEDLLLEAETPMLTREGCTPLWELSVKVEPPAEPETEEEDVAPDSEEAPASEEDTKTEE